MAKKECGKEKNAGNVTARQYEYDNGEIVFCINTRINGMAKR